MKDSLSRACDIRQVLGIVGVISPLTLYGVWLNNIVRYGKKALTLLSNKPTARRNIIDVQEWY